MCAYTTYVDQSILTPPRRGGAWPGLPGDVGVGAAGVQACFHLKVISGCLETFLASVPPLLPRFPSSCCNDLIFLSPKVEAAQVFDV
jgi:hypothetical protein